MPRSVKIALLSLTIVLVLLAVISRYMPAVAAEPRVMFPAGFLLTSTAGPVSGGQLPVSMDLRVAEAAAQANSEQQLVDTDRWTNLSTFFAHGGKQIFYHGMSDPWFSAFDTLDYCERLGRDNGGAEKIRASESASFQCRP